MFKKFRINNRPISPHLLVYSPQISSLFSIWHRLSGVSLASMISLPIIFIKNFSISDFVDSILLQNFLATLSYINWLTNFFYLIVVLLLFYHILNGIRHMLWDTSLFLNIYFLSKSSSAFLFILSLIIGANLFKLF